MSDSQSKFQKLLRELFQFDCAVLDFGIYRIRDHKRAVIERFITDDLPRAIAEELDRGALAAQSQAVQDPEVARKKVLEALGDDALDVEGNLAEEYRDLRTPWRRGSGTWMSTRARTSAGSKSSSPSSGLSLVSWPGSSRYRRDPRHPTASSPG